MFVQWAVEQWAYKRNMIVFKSGAICHYLATSSRGQSMEKSILS